ncbi:MAG TPA: TetR/AcrR family transcriptional regulator [Myxococcaceae bacterium]|nr:TetR/AcrR family transcriptional regulator [Myxococcaceae bacterium]
MSHPSGSPQRQPLTARGRKTRQELLQAAEAVFGEKGFAEASISEITQRAGVAQGTFYVHFTDKKSIFVELVEELGTRMRTELAKATHGLTDRMQIERAGFRAFLTFSSGHRQLYRIVHQAEFVDPAVFRAYYQRMADGYVRGLSQAMDAGQIRRMDPERLAYCLMGIADFLGMRWVLWEPKASVDEVLEDAMALLQRGLELPKQAPEELPKDTPERKQP